MVKSNPPGWWRAGKLSTRLLWLGAFLGTAGAWAFNLNYMVGHINPATLMWGIANLFIFEIPVGALLGLLVALVVLFARTMVPGKAPKMLFVGVTGTTAWLCTSVVVSGVSHDVPVPSSAGLISWMAGILTGCVFAVVTYRHPASNPNRQPPLITLDDHPH